MFSLQAQMTVIARETAETVARALLAEFGPRLRAVVAYGAALTADRSGDIDLLVVVDTLVGPRAATIRTHAAPATEGDVRLRYLTADELRRPKSIADPALREWARQLVRDACLLRHVIVERPTGFAKDVLADNLAHAVLPAWFLPTPGR